MEFGWRVGICFDESGTARPPCVGGSLATLTANALASTDDDTGTGIGENGTEGNFEQPGP
jgi:hypothetical protein